MDLVSGILSIHRRRVSRWIGKAKHCELVVGDIIHIYERSTPVTSGRVYKLGVSGKNRIFYNDTCRITWIIIDTGQEFFLFEYPNVYHYKNEGYQLIMNSRRIAVLNRHRLSGMTDRRLRNTPGDYGIDI